jgi:hypothetical protein
MARRVVAKGPRRTVAGATAGSATLDDRPLEIIAARDGKRVLVVLPYEVWAVNAETLEVEKTIELPSARPSVFEAEDAVLWLGGQHLHRGSLFTGAATKVGTKLGGVVDRVCLVRPTLLCGVGTNGEILWDVEQETDVHRRKTGEREVCGLVATPDGRSVFADGSSQTWVIDPDHASGYMKLRLRNTSDAEVFEEGIVVVGMTTRGATILAARDGAVGWTNRALRLVDEKVPREEATTALAVTGDEQWIYVLRPAGVLHRFLIAQPEIDPKAKEEPEPLPEAQTTKLDRLATCMTMVGEQLVMAGPQYDDQLGRLWKCSPEALEWKPLRVGVRRLQPEVAASETEAKKAPDFTPTRSKIKGPPIATIKVDDVLAGKPAFWVTRSQGTILERPVATLAPQDVLSGDTLLLPAMFRFHEGTARPGLVLWPGITEGQARRNGVKPQLAIAWLTWGDDPRGWIPLDTPSIRRQGWSRREVFPLQTTLARRPPDAPGRRPRIPDAWVDPELFSALVKECKKLLKIVW